MAPEAAADELFEIKNSFYLGNFQQCITDAQKFRVSRPHASLPRIVERIMRSFSVKQGRGENSW